ncbi:hypothetical protein BG015_010458 [Linnemannia schmuckeri]|uniref:SWIM-type domain-containing protein n=1 Tax=Linnemannia schmuckeri TaxID=64567 RepID=A0A9P5V974_9FUNG|nr:hypothetical protein BG015_010458 [Linnemannia schmuckeri]
MTAAENGKEKKGGETWLDKCAKFHLDTRESRGYSGRTISLASEMSLEIESFTQPGVSYEVKIEAIKNPSARGGHYVFCRCSCPVATRDGIVDCHHIALVRIRIPQRTFRGGPPPPLPVPESAPEPALKPALEPTPETTEPAVIVVVDSPPTQDQAQDHDREHWNQEDDFEEVVEKVSEVAVHEGEAVEAVVEEATDMFDKIKKKNEKDEKEERIMTRWVKATSAHVWNEDLK